MRLGLGLGLVDKVLEFTKDTYTSSADYYYYYYTGKD